MGGMKGVVMEKLVRVNERFLSVEGEGSRQGLLTYFLRLQKCSIYCSDCDSKSTWSSDGGRLVPIEIIVGPIEAIMKKVPNLTTVSITGGNPMESFGLPDLIAALKSLRLRLFLEQPTKPPRFYLHLEHSGIFIGKAVEELDICDSFDSICFDIKSKSAVGDRFNVFRDLVLIREFVESFTGTVQFRCMFKTREDLDHYKELLRTVVLDEYPVYFSPCFRNGAIDKEVLEGGLIKEVVGDITMGCYGRGARIGVQLHKILHLR